ncbi:MAG TPA: phosphatidylglycerophosphatase A [Anaerohalosphaeraceae bacterium]|nr:phosphatidylglycerophosphatase A [Anaerohalosphaeraceae bacterium]HOL88777.1 phosphatidylglycerophosphatase A [Anaerohalosphaeraceae bacterium]HPP55962.1 phosphatidylglycerophosphatase A [Anaerohalosphaeraceae bacterium]
MKEWFATSFGLGRLPAAPGTFGSLPPVIFYQVFGFLWPAATAYAMAAVTILFSWFCVQFAPAVIRRTGQSDPREVVADETAGQALTLLAIALMGPLHICNTAVLGFVLFRFFDITKPWPIRKLEALPAGWGILADDLAAGIFAAVFSLLAIRFLPAFFG